MKMNRGEIWDADLGGKAGKRPVLVLTRSNVIPHLTKVVVAEVSTQFKGYPTQVEIGVAANLSKHSYVSCEALHTVAKDILVRYRGELSQPLLKKISQAVVFALDLDL